MQKPSLKKQFESALFGLENAIEPMHMTYDNALYEAERLDCGIKYYASCTFCACPGFTLFRSSGNCTCGHTHQQHQHLIASAIRVLPRKKFYVPHAKPKMITLAIHAHGCDIPIPLFKYEQKDAEYIIPRTRVMSSVPHGCITYYPYNVLSFIQKEFMDPTIDPYHSMRQFSDKMSDDVAERQLDDTLLKINPAQPELIGLRDAFKQLPREKLYFLHTPLAERAYDFVKTQEDIDEKKDELGVFMVHSTYPDDVVLIDYTGSTVLESNNLISDHLHASLHKYLDPIRFYEREYKKKLTLQILLKSVFLARPDLEHLNIIDLGCRVECSPLPFDPHHVDRLYSRDYMAELPAVATAAAATAATAAAVTPSPKADSAQGKRKQNRKKTRKRKHKNRGF